MKRALKVIIPVLVVIALLITAGWFFFFQRPDLTANLLIRQAELMTSHERFERAEMYYNWAWSLEPSREDIPIALAETYVADSNYTKAEYTLVKAISDHPQMVELYVALSQTYVKQDKMLDAVQMLDRTTDPDVKEKLNQMRPAAPVLTPESGYYTDYIHVSAEASAPYIYTTTDGDYPSTEQDLYTEPLVMEAGETTVLALAVDEMGLVSPVVQNGYTVGGVVEKVTLQDEAIDHAVREQLGLDQDDELMSDLLWSITNLVLPETVTTLDDLGYFAGLRSLTLHNVSGMDFSALTKLPALKELDLSGCTISSNAMEAIGSLKELETLILNNCALTDINTFSQLTKLKMLQAANNTLKDIGVVSLMTDLEYVDVSNNPLASIAALSTCSKLKTVNISGCSVTSLGALKEKAELEVLNASNNQIKSISDLEKCKNLIDLEVNSNMIEDISVLPKLPNLVRFSGNQNLITEIPDFDEDQCKLGVFGADYNQISDVSGLAGVHTLNYVYLDYNQVSDISPLADNYGLVQINVWNSDISEEDIALFEERSIIVNYNPNFISSEEEEE